MGFLESFLAKLFVYLLQEFLARNDFRQRVLGEVKTDDQKRAIEALSWASTAANRPDAGADLRVRPEGHNVELPGGDPRPPH
jgi:hypothetical protein